LRFSSEYFKKGFYDWKRELFEFKYLIILSLAIVVLAGYLDYVSGIYVSSKKGPDVPDLILDHFGPYDMVLLFVYGYLVLVFLMFLYPMIFHIRMLHAVVSQFSMLVMIRSLFLIFTHLQTPSDAFSVRFPWVLQTLSFENDMFFSGHTAIPFLAFLLFTGYWIRYVFLAGSLFMGITVLAMHIHYSIDVFSAFFITYCSWRMGNVIIEKAENYIKS